MFHEERLTEREENYKYFVNTISAPFENNILSNFNNMDEISYNYFTSDNYTRFNRPVTDQSFIAMKYNRDLKCWLFDYPDIKAFKGIGNTFYVNTKLKGDEVFKFFVLYSDTEAPAKPVPTTIISIFGLLFGATNFK